MGVMMRAAVIENGKVTNIIEVESLDFLPNLVGAGGGSIGDDYANGVFTPPPPSPPLIPRAVTRRQGLQQLRIEGFTEAQIESMIPTLPISELQKDLALIEFKTSQNFERYRPLTVQMIAMLGKDAAWGDQMFINAAKL